MHGAAGHTLNRVYTEQVLEYLGYSICHSEVEVEQQLQERHFAYLPLDVISPILAELIGLRNVMGLRSPIHTLARLINPFNAKATLQAIFHPAYRTSHQHTAFRLGYQNSAVIKGEGGEFERNPDAKTLSCGIKNGELYEHELPKLTDNRSPIEEELNLAVFKEVWDGQRSHEYGETAAVETIGIALYTMGKCDSYETAMQKPKNSGIPVFQFKQNHLFQTLKRPRLWSFWFQLNETNGPEFWFILVMVIITFLTLFFGTAVDITTTFSFRQMFNFPGIHGLHTRLTLLFRQCHTVRPFTNFNRSTQSVYNLRIEHREHLFNIHDLIPILIIKVLVPAELGPTRHIEIITRWM